MSDAYLAVINPAAGGGRCGKHFPAALERLREAGIEVDTAQTSGPGQASELVRAAWAEGRRRFIAVGGDGTGYEVVNGLFPAATGSTERPVLGFLPLGTGNSFLRDFTDQGAEHTIEALSKGARRPCDVIRLTHADGALHYINILSIGFVADVNGLRARRFKRWGEFGYVLAVITAVAGLRARGYPMRVDEGELDEALQVFSSFNNSKFTGGKMMMAPHADTSDGKIAVIRVGEMGRLSLLATFPKIFGGTHVHHPAVTTCQAVRVELSVSEAIDVMVDGEALQVVPRVLDVLPGALDVVV
ncbi:diacylglycerol/lipid kinase family protein [Paraliomyxa miuraensis]|uniref:diacylglycerol/lipid kinase family protein n=1 Tax=Paraliomyxa miuraensis TaxID=376150 RepID=UPI0022585E93|nr:diacylglycerol kinase family protein [Paraliomyxa miuraensis]MCX4246106.1 diacylglycerol kinase family lipid kinase [Paraliomyxa miuraensis]